MKIRKIAVGSTNPVKVSAVCDGVKERLPETEVLGVEVESGVSEQPMSDDETRMGAEERAKRARKKIEADVGVGLEGGVFEYKKELWGTVWCVVVGVDESEVMAVNGVRLKLPDKVAKEIVKGGELGPVMDGLTGRNEVKKQEGMLGVVTGGWVGRKEGYEQLVRLAMGRLVTEEWR